MASTCRLLSNFTSAASHFVLGGNAIANPIAEWARFSIHPKQEERLFPRSKAVMRLLVYLKGIRKVSSGILLVALR
jgi:hypothetical protein